MAEHEGPAEAANDPELPPIPPGEPSGTAVALALGKAGRDKSFTAEAAAFLRDQRRMLALQMEHLHEQRALQVEHLKHQERHLRLRYFGDRLRIGLQMLGILAGLTITAFVGAMAWDAHEDHGVSIEAFSVPPELAQRGLTGQVVASQLLDKLAALQAKTVTARPASTYANDWGGDIKVEIPETGVSIGEVNRYLRQWLGSETRITGDLVRTPGGLAVTARAGSNAGATFEGADADLDRLMQQAAEAIYAQTQPYRYAVYLSSVGRRPEAIAAFSRLARGGDMEERAWAYTGWATMSLQDRQMRDAARLAGAALRLNPRLHPAYPVLGLSWAALDRREGVLDLTRREITLIQSGRAIGLSKRDAASRLRFVQGLQAEFLGDYRRAIELLEGATDPLDFEGRAQSFLPTQQIEGALFSQHDVTGALRLDPGNDKTPLSAEAAQALGDWALAAAMIERANVQSSYQEFTQQFGRFALAYARAGRLAEAEATLARLPPDCDDCLGARGLIAAARHDWPGADRWFAQAVRQAPPFPFALADWGEVLMRKGDLEGAVQKFAEAHRKSPHFADPLELWGEALMKKGDMAGAAGKFRQADPFAPRWGRNHLMWGEALMLSGRYAEARRQYEIANGLDLSKPDRAALDVLLARTAKGPLHG